MSRPDDPPTAVALARAMASLPTTVGEPTASPDGVTSGLIDRIADLPLESRRLLLTRDVGSAGDWLYGATMQAVPDDAEDGWTPSAIRLLVEDMRRWGALLRPEDASSRESLTLFRAVRIPRSSLPCPWRSLAGSMFVAGARDAQSWGESLDAVRGFYAKHHGTGPRGSVGFVMEARIPARNVVLRMRDLDEAVPAVVAAIGRMTVGFSPSETKDALDLLAWSAEALAAYRSQREVVVDLPSGRALIAAVHPPTP